MSVGQRELRTEQSASLPGTVVAYDSAKDLRPLISIVLPAYNEEALLRDNVVEVCDFLLERGQGYRWEVLIINDGSRDTTGEVADQLAREYPHVRALHHHDNFGLGQALKFGFVNAQGDYIVTLDVDLSYDVIHILELIERIRETRAKMVLASPYMQGGTIRNVPVVRRVLSVVGNRFLRLLSQGDQSTLTSLVRVYDGPFIRSLDLRSMGMDILPEMLYKAMVLRARIDESPARLDWGPQRRFGARRVSSIRIGRQIRSTLTSGFLFRPVPFFLLPGLLTGALAVVVNSWLLIRIVSAFSADPSNGGSHAIASVFDAYPVQFLAGISCVLLTVLLLGLGVIAMQNKRYFEDLYHLGSTERRSLKQPGFTGSDE